MAAAVDQVIHKYNTPRNIYFNTGITGLESAPSFPRGIDLPAQCITENNNINHDLNHTPDVKVNQANWSAW